MAEDLSPGKFTLLTKSESDAALAEFYKHSAKLSLWIKGSTKKFQFTISAYSKNSSLVEIIPDEKIDYNILNNKEVLGSGTLKSLQIFFRGIFSIDNLNKLFLFKFNHDIFKFEKRSSYRVKTYPNNVAKIILKVTKRKNNILTLRKTGDQTKLFLQFASLTGQIEEKLDKEKSSFRIMDISISGLSLVISEHEVEYFDQNNSYKNSIIDFNGKYFEIDEIKALYVIPYIDPMKVNTKLYKVGMKFEKISLESDNDLSKQINKEISSHEFNKIFEDFIK